MRALTCAALVWMLLPAAVDIAAADRDGTVSIDSAAKKTLDAPGAVSALAVSFFGRYVAAGLEDGQIAIWEHPRGDTPPRLKQAHRKRIEALRFSPDARLLATASQDGQLAVWDTSKLERVDQIPAAKGPKPIALDFSSTGEAVAAGYEDGSVAVWGLASPEPVRRFKEIKGKVLAVAFKCRDDNSLLVVGTDRSLLRYDLGTGEGSRVDLRTTSEKKAELELRSAAVAGEGRIIAVGAKSTHIIGNYADIVERQYIKLVDRETGEQAAALEDQVHVVGANDVSQVAVSSNGWLMATTGQTAKTARNVKVWSVVDRKPIGVLELPDAVRFIEFGATASGTQLTVAARKQIVLFPVRFQKGDVPTETLAVFDIEGDPALAELCASLSDIVREEVFNARRYTLVTRSNMKEVIGELELSRTGLVDPATQLKLRRLLNARHILKGRLSRGGADYTLSLRLLNAETGQETPSPTRSVAGPDELKALARQLCSQLMTAR